MLDNRDRTERDTQIINVILHAFRNLAFIKDLPADAFKSSDRVEYSSLQVSPIFSSSLTTVPNIQSIPIGPVEQNDSDDERDRYS